MGGFKYCLSSSRITVQCLRHGGSEWDEEMGGFKYCLSGRNSIIRTMVVPRFEKTQFIFICIFERIGVLSWLPRGRKLSQFKI